MSTQENEFNTNALYATVIGCFVLMGLIIAAPTLIGTVTGFLTGIPGTDGQFDATLSDLGYKFPTGTYDSSVYTEWWYFNLIDPANDLYFLVIYEIDNPANVEGIPSKAYVSLNTYTGNDEVTEDVTLEASDAVLSTTTLDVDMGGRTVKGIDNDNVRIQGWNNDGSITWDLTYTRRVKSYMQYPIPFLNTIMPRLVYMPSAYANGIVTINGTTYTVNNAQGEFEAQWGESSAMSADFWFQYSNPADRFNLDMFQNIFDEDGKITYKGELIEFDTVRRLHLENGYDYAVGEYPTKYLVWANNGKYKVEYTATELNGDHHWTYVWPITETISSGMLDGHYQLDGKLYKKVGLRWVPVYTINGIANYEYSEAIARN